LFCQKTDKVAMGAFYPAFMGNFEDEEKMNNLKKAFI